MTITAEQYVSGDYPKGVPLEIGVSGSASGTSETGN